MPAGRLDIDSTGLLVLTQDGRVAKQLIGEDSGVEKEYLVRVQSLRGGRLPDAELRRLNHGLALDGAALKAREGLVAKRDQLRFILREGKKRQIRRMCELVGLKVVALKRIRIGGVLLGDLPIGQWRYLRKTRTSDSYPSRGPWRAQKARRANAVRAACELRRDRESGYSFCDCMKRSKRAQ